MTSSNFYKLTQEPQNNIPSDYAIEVTKYLHQLEAKGLPIIFSTEHLGLLMGVSPLSLRAIISDNTVYYKTYFVRKKAGGFRWIMAPNEQLKYIQTWIKINILDKVILHGSAHGFTNKKSIYTNAEHHINKDVLLNIDLYRFFDTITLKRVYGLINNLGYAKNLAYDMSYLLCTKPPENYWNQVLKENTIKFTSDPTQTFILPQGSPASPIISNILCFKLDSRFKNLADKLDCIYTRYADDITFSGERKNIPSINTIKKIIHNEGFYVNLAKIKYIPKSKRQLVTGVVVNDKISVVKSLKKCINQHLHFCIKYGVQNHLEHLEKKGISRKSNYKQWILGNISFINSIERNTAKKMFAKFDLVNWDL